MFDPDLRKSVSAPVRFGRAKGCPEGRDRIHWLRAEAEFRENLRAGIAGTRPYNRTRNSTTP